MEAFSKVCSLENNTFCHRIVIGLSKNSMIKYLCKTVKYVYWHRISQSFYHLNMFNGYDSQSQTLVSRKIDYFLDPILPN